MEVPSRSHLNRLPRKSVVIGVMVIMASVCAVGVVVNESRGFPGRINAHVEAIFNESKNLNPRFWECHMVGKDVPECQYGGQKLGVIVIGDSHAASTVRSVERALPVEDMHVLDWTLSACPTMAGVKKKSGALSPNCGDFVVSRLAMHKKLDPQAPMLVINRMSLYALGSNDVGTEGKGHPKIYFDGDIDFLDERFLQEYRSRYVETVCGFAKHRKVYLVRPLPEMKVNVPRVMGRALMLGKTTRVSISLAEYHQRNQFSWSVQDEAHQRCGAQILDPLPYFCSDGYCWGDKDGRPMYYDSNHLSEYGGSQLVPMFKEIFR